MQQLSPTDAWQLFLEAPSTRNQISALSIYDPSTAPARKVTFDDILAKVSSRLRLAPPFRRRLVTVPLGLDEPYWIEDERFDLEYHVRHLAVPHPGGWPELATLAGRLHSWPLDMTRPPWELYMIEGVGDIEGGAPGCFALLLKLHHAAIDGMAGTQLLTALHDRSLDESMPDGEDTWAPERAPSDWHLIGRAAVRNALLPVRAGRVITRQIPALRRVRFGLRPRPRVGDDIRRSGLTVPRTRFNGRVTPHKVIEYRRWRLADVRAIKSTVPGATVNDVALAIVSGGLRQYLMSKGELPEQSLVALVPVSVRTAAQAGTAGNHLELIRTPLHTEVPTPLGRLACIQRSTARAKAVRTGIPAQVLAGLSEELPGRIVGTAHKATTEMAFRLGAALAANTTVSNVPGPREPQYFAGARMVRQLGAGPVVNGMGLLHLPSSYCNDFLINVTACREMMPDPVFYGDCLDASFAELHQLTTTSDDTVECIS